MRRDAPAEERRENGKRVDLATSGSSFRLVLRYLSRSVLRLFLLVPRESEPSPGSLVDVFLVLVVEPRDGREDSCPPRGGEKSASSSCGFRARGCRIAVSYSSPLLLLLLLLLFLLLFSLSVSNCLSLFLRCPFPFRVSLSVCLSPFSSACCNPFCETSCARTRRRGKSERAVDRELRERERERQVKFAREYRTPSPSTVVVRYRDAT